MGGITPVKTKQKVVSYWLSGLTRDEIAKKLGISEGSVSSIVQQSKGNIPDVDLLRELAVGLKKLGFDLPSFASAYRLRALMEARELADDQIDELIQDIDEHCFKRGMEVKAFVEQINRTSLFSEKYACPIDELDELKTEKENKISQLDYEIQNLRKELQDLKSRRQAALAKAGLTEQDISDYRENEPLVNRIHELEDESASVNQKIMYLDIISWQRDMSGAALPVGSLPDGMTFKDVVRACFLIAKNPSHFGNLINSVNEQEPTLPYKTQVILDPPVLTKHDIIDSLMPSFP